MKSKYMLQTMVIPSPSNPKHLLDVCLELLIAKLQNLLQVGVLMHDNAMNQIFMIRAALMWTVNELPAY
ncbi:UNVERIFIED_CONTAM: hypothetical protein Slati_1710500 [Sesamum latifolium]|uniref:Uncharacterized protein n=1 Tax=Sesamum latifolium TaxID=2727402 RepID=A0AAW2X120_9LAMI